MENNNEKEPKNFSTGSGTGVLSSIIFMIIVLVVMYLLSKYLG